MDAVQRFGWKDVKSIAQHVGTRTPTQVRTHAQKLFLRQQKEQTGAAHPPRWGVVLRGGWVGWAGVRPWGRGGSARAAASGPGSRRLASPTRQESCSQSRTGAPTCHRASGSSRGPRATGSCRPLSQVQRGCWVSVAGHRSAVGTMRFVPSGAVAVGRRLERTPASHARGVCRLRMQALQEAGYLAQMQDQAASSGLTSMPPPVGLPSSSGLPCSIPIPSDLAGMSSKSDDGN